VANYFAEKYAGKSNPDELKPEELLSEEKPVAGNYFAQKYSSQKTPAGSTGNFFENKRVAMGGSIPLPPREPDQWDKAAAEQANKGFFEGSVIDQLIASWHEHRASQKKEEMVSKARKYAVEEETKDQGVTRISGASIKGLSGYVKSKDPEVQKKHFEESRSELQRLVNEAGTHTAKAEAKPFSAETKAFIDENSDVPMWEAFRKAPHKIIIELGSRSGVQSLAAAAPAALAGLVGGPAGFAAGMGYGSYKVQYAHSLLENLKKKGVDTSNVDSVLAAVANEELMREVETQAAKEAIMVAGPDMIGALFGAKMLTPAIKNAVVRKVANVAVQAPIQAVTGMAGEAGRELVANEEFKPREIAAEGIAEFATTPIDIAAAGGSRQANEDALESLLKKGSQPPPGGSQPPSGGSPAPAGPQKPLGPLEATRDEIEKLEALIRRDEENAAAEAANKAREETAAQGGDLLKQELAASGALVGDADQVGESRKERSVIYQNALAAAEQAETMASPKEVAEAGYHLGSGEAAPPALPIPTEPLPSAALAADVDEPAKTSDMVRVYHSGSKGEGESSRWVSTDPKYAANYRADSPLFYTDIPADDPRVNSPDYPDEQGLKQGFTFNFELTPQEATTLQEVSRDEVLKETPVKPATPEIEQAAALTPAGGTTPEGEKVEATVTVHDLPGTLHERDHVPPHLAYGSFANTKGVDVDEIDFIQERGGESGRIFVIDHMKKKDEGGGFEQHKVMIGFPNQVAARRGHHEVYPNNQAGAITEMSVADFKKWVAQPQTGSVSSRVSDEPISESVETKPARRERKVVKSTEVATKPELFITWGNQRHPVASIEDAQDKWNQFRTESNAGASELPPAHVVDASGKKLGKISYNGNYWPEESTETKPTRRKRKVTKPEGKPKAKVHKGTYYFPSHVTAKQYAEENGFPTDRIVEYGRGHAIQLKVSGPYVGPNSVVKPATETIIPEQDTPVGVNYEGDRLYERADGSRYKMRNGRPDFGGDLAPVTEVEKPTPKPKKKKPRYKLAEKQTKTPEFKKWFGDSKVVDENGGPLVVYHGTKSDFEAFTPNKWFAEDPKLAQTFIAGGRHSDGRATTGSNVMPVYLAIKKPLDIRLTDSVTPRQLFAMAGVSPNDMSALAQIAEDDAKPKREAFYQKYGGNIEGSFPMFGKVGISTRARDATMEGWLDNSNLAWSLVESSGFVAALKALGFDGIKSSETRNFNPTLAEGRRLNRKLEENVQSITWMAFNPNQIKSATGNRGTFDSANPDIRFRKPGATTGQPLTRQQATEILQPLLTKLPGLKLKILNSPREAPGRIRAMMKADGRLDAPGIFDTETGEIYIFSENNTNADELIQTALHEGVGHLGLRALAPDEASFDALMDDIYANAENKAELQAVAGGGLDLVRVKRHPRYALYVLF